MPIHEYSCHACGHDFETLVRASETAACTAGCGTCGNPAGPGACRFN